MYIQGHHLPLFLQCIRPRTPKTWEWFPKTSSVQPDSGFAGKELSSLLARAFLKWRIQMKKYSTSFITCPMCNSCTAIDLTSVACIALNTRGGLQVTHVSPHRILSCRLSMASCTTPEALGLRPADEATYACHKRLLIGSKPALFNDAEIA